MFHHFVMVHENHVQCRRVREPIKEDILAQEEFYLLHTAVGTYLIVVVDNARGNPWQHLDTCFPILEQHDSHHMPMRLSVECLFTLLLGSLMRYGQVSAMLFINPLHDTSEYGPMRRRIFQLMDTNKIVNHFMDDGILHLFLW